MKSGIVAIVLGLAMIQASITSADTPEFINFQGYLTGPGGGPLNATVDLTFNIYNSAAAAGTPLWNEVHEDVVVNNGLFNVALGLNEPFGDVFELDFDAGDMERWLQVLVGGPPPVPPLLLQIASEPYALRAGVAQVAQSLEGGMPEETDPQVGANTLNRVPRWDSDELVTGTLVDPDTGNIGIGATDPLEDLHIASGTPGVRLDTAGDDYEIIADGNNFTIGEVGVAAPRLRIDTDGEVGIGTVTPATLLDVNGATTIRGDLDMEGNEITEVNQIQVLDGAADGMVLTSDPNGFGSWADPDDVFDEVDPQVGANTLNRVPRWDSDELVTGRIVDPDTGNIGIGAADPQEDLHIASGTPGIRLQDTTADEEDYELIVNGDNFAIREVGVAAPRLTIDTDGDVGIGLGPNVQPAGRLDVRDEDNFYLLALGVDANQDTYLRAGTANGIVSIGDAQTLRTLIQPNNGRVGIGTTDPAATLDVNGNAVMTAGLSLRQAGFDPVNNNMSADITHDGSQLLFRMGGAGGNVPINFSMQDNSALFIDGNRNVGINRANPTARLHIRQRGANDRDNGLYVERAGTDVGAVIYMDPDGVARIGTKEDPGTASDRDHLLLNPLNGEVGVVSNLNMMTNDIYNVRRIQVLNNRAAGRVLTSDANGYGSWQDDVGITQERDPQVDDPNLTINSVPRWTGSALVGGTIVDNGSIGIGATAGAGYRLDVIGQAIIRNHLTVQNADIWLDADHTIRSPWGRLNIQSGSGQALSLNPAGGNVGIGTANPGAKLHVSEPGLGNVEIKADRASYVNAAQLALAQGGLTRWLLVDRDWGALAAGQARRFDIYDAIAGAPRLSISDNGNVGIGTPAPAVKLDVNGDAVIRNTLLIDRGVGDFRIQTASTDYHSGHYQFFALRAYEYWWWPPEDRTVLVPAYAGFRITDRANSRINFEFLNEGDLYTTRDVYARGVKLISDARIKFDQRPLDYGLAQIMALEPKRYNSAEYYYDLESEQLVIHPEKAKNDIGLVAQDVHAIIPEAVSISEDENHELLAISYATLIPVLVKAIQEQQAQIEELKNEIQAMKSER